MERELVFPCITTYETSLQPRSCGSSNWCRVATVSQRRIHSPDDRWECNEKQCQTASRPPVIYLSCDEVRAPGCHESTEHAVEVYYCTLCNIKQQNQTKRADEEARARGDWPARVQTMAKLRKIGHTCTLVSVGGNEPRSEGTPGHRLCNSNSLAGGPAPQSLRDAIAASGSLVIPRDMPVTSDKCSLIEDLRVGMKNLDMVFIVLESGVPTITKGGRSVRTVRVADSTACINMAVWDEPGELLQEGDILRITRGYACLWRGALTLYAGKTGDLQKVGEFCMLFNEDINMSDPTGNSRKLERPEPGIFISNNYVGTEYNRGHGRGYVRR
ncbi:hypothetical protein ACJJTC_002411 [Scirpophaga incertulas]